MFYYQCLPRYTILKLIWPRFQVQFSLDINWCLYNNILYMLKLNIVLWSLIISIGNSLNLPI